MNKSNLDFVRKQSCISCGSRPVDAHHIKSRGSGGSDSLWNLLPCCRKCHSLVHHIGLRKYAEKYLNVSNFLDLNGWTMLNGKIVHVEEDQMKFNVD